MCSENKGADQLRGYREADLRLCFRICKLLVFLCSGSNVLAAGSYHCADRKQWLLSAFLHYENSPMQYTEIF